VVGEIYDEDDTEEYAVDSRDISRYGTALYSTLHHAEGRIVEQRCSLTSFSLP
jgi:hypothetical protein